MTGEDFMNAIGPYERLWNEDKEDYDISFDNEDLFNHVRKKVKVIARTSSEDKFVLITGTKKRGGMVAMTGDSITDAEALRKADVGLCMGSGCEVAKDNSDLIILDNDFYSIYRSIKWGRAIFDNIRKFVQFQLTVNLVICFITIIGGCTIGRIPLNIIQMLWVNLIMDVLGAIALGTEAPRVEGDSRISRKDPIVTSIMWRQIICMSVYQIVVMLVLMFFGEMIFFKESFNLITAPLRIGATGGANTPLKLDTIQFYVFILMNLFNQFNCRIVEDGKFNIFSGIFRNWFFIFVTAFEFFLTFMMVDIGATSLGSSLIGTANLNGIEHLVCWLLGASVLLWGAALKKIPAAKFDIIAQKISLEEDREDDPLNQMFRRASEAHNKARKSIGVGKDDGVTNPGNLAVSASQVEQSKVEDDDTNENESEN